MINKGIIIEWDGGTEYIPFDFNSINSNCQIVNTLEYWKSTKEFVSYNTTSKVVMEENSHILEIYYGKNLNKHISPQETLWGVSKIHITNGATSGEVEWNDDTAPETNNTNKTWNIIDNGLHKLPVKVVSKKIKRNQARLRKALLGIDASCAITGEKTVSVLEAAHIISSSEFGGEVIENSILLRSDIHRLFDEKLFKISNSGEIVEINDGLSDYYRELLIKRKYIDQKASNRVAHALEMVLELSTNAKKGSQVHRSKAGNLTR